MTHHTQPEHVLIFLPNWVGDVVMATPTLRALRELYPDSQMRACGLNYIRPILEPCPWLDDFIETDENQNGQRKRLNTWRLSRKLAAHRFDLALLLTNSFRTALITRLAGIPHRLGYDRDGRGPLLTDRIVPPSENGQLIPVPTIEYYLELVRHLGAENPSGRMELFSTAEQEVKAESILDAAGLADGRRPRIVINPGAGTKGTSKMWPIERYAAFADYMQAHHGAAVLVSGSPAEAELRARLQHHVERPVHDLTELGCDFATLKALIARCDLMVSNDTGPRHIAAAMGTPLVSIFGPTDPVWTILNFEDEIIVREPTARVADVDLMSVVIPAEILLARRGRIPPVSHRLPETS